MKLALGGFLKSEMRPMAAARNKLIIVFGFFIVLLLYFAI
jgi:hypothetical protein